MPEGTERHTSTRPSADYAFGAQLQRGFAFHRQGRLLDAGRIYGEILQRAPDHFDALHLLGVIACRNGSYEQAVQLISKAISINPRVALAHYNRASALQELGRLEEALVSYDKAVALQPDFAESYSNRGNVLQELGRLEEALGSYDKAIALKPGFAEPCSNRGNVLQELGRLEEALVCYKKAIALRPNYAEAYSNCGVTFYELKRFEESLVSCDKAIALKPDFAEAYSNRGNALKELDRLEEALSCYDRAIVLKPNYAEAHSNRGNVLKELNRFEEALVSCDKAIELKPDFADAYSSRGNALYELDRFDEALVSFEKAIALKPVLADAYSNMGRVLNARGRLDEARVAFLRAIDIQPTNVGAYFNLADSMAFAASDPHLAAMQKLVVAPAGLSKTDRVKLNFALGKAYADLKDHRRSFLHMLAANAGKRAMVAYDEKAALVLFDRIEATFSRELIAARSGGGDPSRRPIFILGMPRSGTTLVEQILASHPMVNGAGELDTLSEVVLAVRGPGSQLIPYPDFVPTLDRAALTSIGEHYLAALNDRAPRGERVTDKMPSNYYFAGLIHLALPNAKIIHTVRDPLDTCISCFSKLFAGGQNYTYDLGELGRYYKRYERLMTHWRRVLPSGRILDVRYEDIVADLETQVRRVLSYCGLPWDDRCLSFHETDRPVRTASVTQVRQPIYRSAVGRWRDCDEFIGPLLTALGPPAVEASLE